MSAITSGASSIRPPHPPGASGGGSASGVSGGQRPEGPPPPPRGGDGVGQEVKSALESQGLAEEDLQQLRTDIESTIDSGGDSTDAEILDLLESYGVDTEQLSTDLAELADGSAGESDGGLSAAHAVLQALFAFDQEA